VTREVSRKISRDSFVSYNGNRYSVPYKYAGREARVQIEGRRLRIFAGSDKVCEHEILAGSHRVSRDKEHFRGLLSEVLLENKSRSNRGSPVLRFNDPVVESPASVSLREVQRGIFEELSGDCSQRGSNQLSKFWTT